jgi:hypothetical protein
VRAWKTREVGRYVAEESERDWKGMEWITTERGRR